MSVIGLGAITSMNGEMAIKAIGLHQFGRPEVLGVATKEEPHARPDDNMHGRAAASAVPTSSLEQPNPFLFGRIHAYRLLPPFWRIVDIDE